MDYSNLVVLIDAGHGGIVNGNYVTPGKRSPVWEDGTQLFEGVFNREVVEWLTEFLKHDGIEYIYLDSNLDIDLTERVKIYNSLYDSGYKNMLLISIHANAAEAPAANGFEIYTTPGQSASDTFAELWYGLFDLKFPQLTMRTDVTDGDHDKEARFYVITQTKFPSVLIEHGFMTNKAECKNILMDDGWRKNFAALILECIKRKRSEKQ